MTIVKIVTHNKRRDVTLRLRIELYESPVTQLDKIVMAAAHAVLALKSLAYSASINVEVFDSAVLGRPLLIFLVNMYKPLSKEEAEKLGVEEGVRLQLELAKIEPHEEKTIVVIYKYDTVSDTVYSVLRDVLKRELGITEKREL